MFQKWVTFKFEMLLSIKKLTKALVFCAILCYHINVELFYLKEN